MRNLYAHHSVCIIFVIAGLMLGQANAKSSQAAAAPTLPIPAFMENDLVSSRFASKREIKSALLQRQWQRAIGLCQKNLDEALAPQILVGTGSLDVRAAFDPWD